MQAPIQIDIQTSNQLDQIRRAANNNRSTIIPFTIDGCTVSFTPIHRGTDEPMKAIKDILMSAYRTKATNR